MKKKLLSLIIAFVLLGSGLVFGACVKNGGGYNLSNLVTDYKTEIDNISNVNVLTDNTIEFDYSQYKQNDDTYLLSIINSYYPYIYLQAFYNKIFDNAMAFVYDYIGTCSTSAISAPKEVRNEIRENLDELVFSLKKTSSNVEAVADKIRKGNPALESEALDSLKNLFDSYDELYQSAFNFSSTLSRIYFNYGFENANPDYSSISLQEYDSTQSVLMLNSRIKYHTVNLTQAYVEMNVSGSTLSTLFTNEDNIASLPTSFNNYMSQISAIDYVVDDSLGEAINDSESKQDFLNAQIALHNCIAILNNNYDLYNKAFNEVVYVRIINDLNATKYEISCTDIIRDFNHVVSTMNDVIANTIKILKSI